MSKQHTTKAVAVSASKTASGHMLDSIGRNWLHVRKDDREMLRDSYNIGLDSFNGYLPRIRTDETLLNICISHNAEIREQIGTNEGAAVIYTTESKSGEVHGGLAEAISIKLIVDGRPFSKTALLQIPRGTFVLAGMFGDALNAFSLDQVRDKAREHGSLRVFRVTLPEHAEGTLVPGRKNGETFEVAGMMLGEIAKPRSLLLVPDETHGILPVCLHTGRDDGRCNKAVSLGDIAESDGRKLKFALGLIKREARTAERNAKKRAAKIARKVAGS
jgi:hypothetical protein